jgi:hypothetical protein
MACGYKNPEAVLEDLRNPSYNRYFTVVNDDNTHHGHSTNVARATFLLAIHTLRQQKSSDKISFKDYLRKFMSTNSSDEDDQQVNVAIPSSLGLVVTLMRELQSVPGCSSLLHKTLEHVAFTLKRVEPGALFKTHSRTAFILDASLNDTRSFLIDLVHKNKGADSKLVTLALKVLLSLAVVRKSVEDILTVCSLLSNDNLVKGEVDLREEIMMLKASTESSAENVDEEEDF